MICKIAEQDNKSLLSLEREEKKRKRGHNKVTIILSIKTFKSLCLKAGTKKSNEIHEYYIKLEAVIQEVL